MAKKQSPVDVLKALHDAGFVTDDALKKLDIPKNKVNISKPGKISRTTATR